YEAVEFIHSTGEFIHGLKPDPDFLLDKILDLEKRCAELACQTPTPIELPLWKWNQKAARRRYRRLIREDNQRIVNVRPQLLQTAQKVLDQTEDREPDPGLLSE